MHLNEEEKFALKTIVDANEITGLSILSQIDLMEVIKREGTGVGFFTDIRLPKSLTAIKKKLWDRNFDHRLLKHGGSFMCWVISPEYLQLEAVTFDGDWPIIFSPDDFKFI